MPTLDVVFKEDEFAAMAMAAHVEGMTLNAFVVSVLQDESIKTIELYEKSPGECPADVELPSSDAGTPTDTTTF